MAIPLRHFVVALGFLLVSAIGALVMAVTSLPGLETIAYTHAVLVGWIVLTIMGAMTQFVPVWSGVAIHSRRLAALQLWLVTVGVLGLILVLLTGRLALLPLVTLPLLVGIWAFVYNVGRTLVRARPLDVTEGHFAAALLAFGLLAPLGSLLAVDFTTQLIGETPVTRVNVLTAHATLALFGAILLTVVGALYQLATMFTGRSMTARDHRLQRLESASLPAGVFTLALGRGLESALLAHLGAVAILIGLLAFLVVLSGLLGRATVERSPMTDRYRIVAVAIGLWIVLTAPTWLSDPLAFTALWGHPDASALLLFGVFGFVVVGSLYHIVPFIIWIDRYSDRLGFESVPMIDDLYDDRLERIDYVAFLVGTTGLVAADLLALPAWSLLVATTVLAGGVVVFLANMLATIHRHGPAGVPGVIVPSIKSGRLETTAHGTREGLEIED